LTNQGPGESGSAVGENGKFISEKTVQAIEVLVSVQATRETLARILKVDPPKVDEILAEIRSFDLPLLSTRAKDNRLYYWLDKSETE
jgi:hypothetical protein